MKRDETKEFQPQFDSQGLIPCVVQSANTKQVLMVAYMNKDALKLTLQTGEAHYWSRSRQEIWHKGATSGNVQSVKSIQIDCDQDCVLIHVSMPRDAQGSETACHTGRSSCFYRTIAMDQDVDQDENESITLHLVE